MSVTIENLKAQEPAAEFHPSAEPHLDEETRAAVLSLIERLHAHARRCDTPLLRTQVRGYVDPEEPLRWIVVKQVVNLPVAKADAYWETLEAPYRDWLASLSPELSERMLDHVSLEVKSAV